MQVIGLRVWVANKSEKVRLKRLFDMLKQGYEKKRGFRLFPKVLEQQVCVRGFSLIMGVPYSTLSRWSK